MPVSFEAAAPMARRMRLQRILTASLLAAAVMIVSLIAAQAGFLDHKFVQAVYMIACLSLFCGLGVWFGLRKNFVPCPRCGWNIFFTKTMPILAARIPSSCPNCGLDLERPYGIRSGPSDSPHTD
jgi:hypothetical protein